MKHLLVTSLSVVCAGLTQGALAQKTLPVYHIVKAGATDSEVSVVSKNLLLPAVRARSLRGRVSMVDTDKFLSLPRKTAPESNDLKKLRAATANKETSIPIQVDSLDLAALDKVTPLDEKVAVSKATLALRAAGLEPQFGTPMVGHHVLTMLTKRADGGWDSKPKTVDTSVIYKLTEPNGYQLVGPGAQVQLTFDEKGAVSRFHYAAHRMQAGPAVQVLSEDEVDKRILKLAPAGAKISKRLVYWCPPIEPWLDGTSNSPATTILPWYAYSTTFEIKGANGAVREVKSRIHMMPATDDARFVPSVKLTASANGAQVTAQVAVTGGTGPYRIIWGGSDPRISATNANSIRYTAQRRWSPAMAQERGLTLNRTEMISATVIDANGVYTIARSTVPVRAQPLSPGSSLNAESILNELMASTNPSAGAGLTGSAVYGEESPADPGEWTACRVGWQHAMFTPGSGSGTQRFCWMSDDAWTGDFVEPHPAGSLVSQPWIHGDADYANWGINTADLVLHIGDGNSDGFTQMQPGAPAADYATGWVGAPVYQPTMNINGHGFGTPAGYNVNYDSSWGPTGPNDTLYWLLMDDCDGLDPTGSGGLNVAQRWGPAFNGLHVFTGFSDTENGDGPFEHDVAANLLGLNGPPKTIVQSWFDSAYSNGTGVPCAMGPAVQLSIFTFSDLNDYYWGKGGVGPTIVPSQWPAPLLSYWYINGSNPAVLELP